MQESLIFSEETRILNSFLNAFRQFDADLQSNLIEEEKSKSTQFFRDFDEVKIKEEAAIEIFAPQFNLFSILKIAHLEERVHSPFLANLLNPEGTHGQGRLFFELFIDHIFSGRVPKNVVNIEIKEEYSTFNGDLDIFIRCEIDSRPYFIVIENKIYARDQHKQLERYHEALRKLFSITNNYLMIYLTPYGSKPSQDSISDELFMDMENSGNLLCLSYTSHIRQILEKSLGRIKAPVVKETVSQYLQSIKNL